MDRTVFNGTGYPGQYSAQVFEVWENIDLTPDDYLLWFQPHPLDAFTQERADRPPAHVLFRQQY